MSEDMTLSAAYATARKLVEEALFLRMNGERPPGAPRDNLKAETWRDWDTRAEKFLRSGLKDPMIEAGFC